jgi:hypothetical protein
MGVSRNTLVLIGAIIAILGLLAVAVPVFTTSQTKDVAKIGDLKVQTKEETSHVIPPFVGPGALVLGVVLIGAGMMARR